MSVSRSDFRAKMLLTSAALALLIAPGVSHAQLVNSGDLVITMNSAGNPGQLWMANPNATTANINVLGPVVVAEWTDFNVPATTTLNITNGSAAAQASLLSRVVGAGASDIGGTINASDVNFWLINQNGIIFGGDADVTANSLVATTLDVSSSDFFDLYSGSDTAGNGADTVNFSGGATGGITSARGATITTDGSLVFAGQDLNLVGAFDSGTGRSAFVAASDVDVQFAAGSPLAFTLNAGTTVASQSVGGFITGAGADFQMLSAAGVVGGLLQIDASVTATTATATGSGILLSATGAGAGGPAVNLNGVMTSTGEISLESSGNLSATANISGGSVDVSTVSGGVISALDITASSGAVSLSGSAVSAGTLGATGGISVDATGAIALTSATAGNALVIGGLTSPSSLTVTGLSQGDTADIQAVGAANLGDVTITGGALDIVSTTGNIDADVLTAAGSLAVMAANDVTLSSVTAQTILAEAAGDIILSSGAVLDAGGSGDSLVLSGTNFINNSGAGALQTAGGGRFLVYSTDWDANTPGGVTAGNLYNTSYSATPPASVAPAGDRFIYTRQPVLTVAASDASREYGLANPAFSFSASGLVNGDSLSEAIDAGNVTYATAATAASDVGNYDLSATGGTSPIGYAIMSAGTPATLSVNPALLSIVADDASREYGFANPALTGTLSGYRNGDDDSDISGLTYASAAMVGSDVGTYAINGSGASATNYVFDYNAGALTVNPAVLSVTANDTSREYGLANPGFTGTVTGFRNSDTDAVISGLTYSSPADITSDVGTYDITGSGASAVNYIFDYSAGTLSVNPALLSVVADDASREYGLVNPAFSGTVTGYRNGDDDSVISGLTYASAAMVGSDVRTYTIEASGASADNYIFDYAAGELSVTPAVLTVTANDAAREYGLENPTFSGVVTGYRNADDGSVISGLSYSSPAGQGGDVGTYAITGSGASAVNYIFDYTAGTLTVDPALLSVVTDNAAREYGLDNPAFTGVITGFRNADDIGDITGPVYTSAADAQSGVGTYAISAGRASATNYIFTYTGGVLTVSPATLTVTADDAAREYGLSNPALSGTVAGFRNDDDASDVSGLTYATDATAASGVGLYAITGSGAAADNYVFEYNAGDLSVSPAALNVKANDAVREYGLSNPAFSGAISGFRNGDTESVISGLNYASPATPGSNVGTYAITGSGGAAANYTLDYSPGTLTVNSALLNVTANDASREYGLENPALTGTITGFRNSDDAAVVSGLTYNTAAQTGSDVGEYAINPGGASATNYSFTYAPGTLDVTPALLNVAVNDAARAFGAPNPDFTADITGLRNEDTQSALTGLTFATDADIRSVVGDYEITASGASATNYDFTYASGTLTVETRFELPGRPLVEDLIETGSQASAPLAAQPGVIEFVDTSDFGDTLPASLKHKLNCADGLKEVGCKENSARDFR